ncbi:MAG: hypothetical protein GX128_09925 [Bacteroidales bacterium]|jgi:hypothetical protein|nr:hypothetical protein [Bacteroidales bacterium]
MTEINYNNYEAFFLDYLEGRLSQRQIDKLIAFVDSHPELKDEFKSLEFVKLIPDESISFKGKEMLKKQSVISVGNMNEQNYEEVFVAAFEKDLSEIQSLELNQFLDKNPALRKEFNLIGKSRLSPDTSIVYPDKESLKKTLIVPFASRLFYYGVAAAAILLLLLALKFIFIPSAPDKENNLFTENPVENKVIETPKDIPLIQEPEIKTEKLHDPGKKTLLAEVKKAEKSEDEPFSKSQANAQLPVKVENIGTMSTLSAIINIENNRIVANHSYYFSENFNDLAIAQQIRHADAPEKDFNAGRLLAQGSAVINEVFKPEGKERNLMPGKNELLKIANIGIQGFAWLTGADIELRKEKDENGNIISYAFESQSFRINQNLNKNN